MTQLQQSKEVDRLEIELGLKPSRTSIKLKEFLTLDTDLLKLKDKVLKLSISNIPVMITGETGVGKELIAQALHGDRFGEFIAVNCGGIPDTLLEVEFFGAKKGAYTGCSEDRRGYIQEAQDGTLFLDEIGEMPLLLQCKLLRALQEKKTRRIGDTKEYQFNCRIVSATNSNIRSSQIFRKDLYYRLAGSVLNIKPLRDRPGDITLILENLGIKWENIFGSCTHEPVLDGNVRELLNLIEEYKIENS